MAPVVFVVGYAVICMPVRSIDKCGVCLLWSDLGGLNVSRPEGPISNIAELK